MKKLLSIILLIALSALAIYSCTEQQVKPSTQNGGGGVSDKVER